MAYLEELLDNCFYPETNTEEAMMQELHEQFSSPFDAHNSVVFSNSSKKPESDTIGLSLEGKDQRELKAFNARISDMVFDGNYIIRIVYLHPAVLEMKNYKELAWKLSSFQRSKSGTQVSWKNSNELTPSHLNSVFSPKDSDWRFSNESNFKMKMDFDSFSPNIEFKEDELRDSYETVNLNGFLEEEKLQNDQVFRRKGKRETINLMNQMRQSHDLKMKGVLDEDHARHAHIFGEKKQGRDGGAKGTMEKQKFSNFLEKPEEERGKQRKRTGPVYDFRKTMEKGKGDLNQEKEKEISRLSRSPEKAEKLPVIIEEGLKQPSDEMKENEALKFIRLPSSEDFHQNDHQEENCKEIQN